MDLTPEEEALIKRLRKSEQAEPPADASSDRRWVDPTAKAFSLIVPAGWSIEGGLRIFERGLKYEVFTLSGPNSAVVFWGDDRLPFRATVPGQWHGPLIPAAAYKFVPPLKMMPWHSPQANAPMPFPDRHIDPMNNAAERIVAGADGKIDRQRIPSEIDPIQRIWFGAGETAQQLYLGYYTPAAQLYHPVLFPRVGAVLPERIIEDTDQIALLRRLAGQAGVHNKRVDACIVDFVSLDRRWKGRVHLSTYGGDQPGETWECNFIHGFLAPAANIAMAQAAHAQVLASYSTDPKWLSENDDLKAARLTTLQTEHDTGQWRESEAKKAATHRAEIDQIYRDMVDDIKSRQHS